MKKSIKQVGVFFSSVTTALFLPITMLAQTVPGYNAITDIGDPSTALQNIVRRVGNYFGAVILAISVIMILISAFNFLTAGGNEDKIKAARSYIIYALVGVAVALLAFFLPTIVEPILRNR